jgi:hypothetical protein
MTKALFAVPLVAGHYGANGNHGHETMRGCHGGKRKRWH